MIFPFRPLLLSLVCLAGFIASPATADEAWKASWISVNAAKASERTIEVNKALYGVAGDPAKQIDLTKKIQDSLQRGSTVVSADNKFAGTDPAHGSAKTLELEYSLDGAPRKQSLSENTSFDLSTGEKSPQTNGPQADPNANQWTCFRTEIDLEKAPTSAIARIAADSKYWLWINGELAVFEGQLKRGPTPSDTYFDRVDLTKFLHKGKNTIAVLLWYFGNEGFSHKSSGQPGLVFDAQIDGKPLLSGTDWKALIHPAHENTGEPRPNFRLPESNIRFDSRKDLAGWQNPGFDDSAWPTATSLGVPPCAPWNHLVERPIPQWKNYGLRDYTNAAELPKISDGQPIKAKLPYNAQVTPYLKIEGPAGQLVELRTDQYVVHGPTIRGEYVTRDGVQEYENLGWMNGHEVHYTIPAAFKIHALKFRETGYDTEFTGSFECDDPFLNTLRQKALRTLYITMRDTYMDCPDRERAQWWGDLVNEMGEAFYALDPRANALAKKAILELANWQRSDNTLYSPIPDGNWNRELPMQMLNSVGYYGFWTYYLYSGDLDTIRQVYPAVKRYLSVWQIGPDGLVIPRKGQWTWGDWGDNKDMTVLFNAWFYLALKGQKLMAEALGETADLPEITARMQSIEQNFNKTFWTGTQYRSPDYMDQTDDRANALAVLAGLAKPDQYEAIRRVLLTKEHSSPYMEKYVGEALYQMGFADDAIARTKKRFAPMVESPHTTLWEHFKNGGGGTVNHAWSGGTLTLLSQYAAGISPTSPGYATYQILPQMGPLKHIKTTVPSVKGEIPLELRNDPDTFSLNLVSPKGTIATIGVPKPTDRKIETVTINDNLVWKNGEMVSSADGVSFAGEDANYLTFRITPGPWEIAAKFSGK